MLMRLLAVLLLAGLGFAAGGCASSGHGITVPEPSQVVETGGMLMLCERSTAYLPDWLATHAYWIYSSRGEVWIITEVYAEGFEPDGWQPKLGRVFIEPLLPIDPIIRGYHRNARISMVWTGETARRFWELLFHREGYRLYPFHDSYGLFMCNCNTFVKWTARYSEALGNPLPGFKLSWTSHGSDPGDVVLPDHLSQD